MDWENWQHVLVVVIVFMVLRLWFERWLDKDIRRTIHKRYDSLPKFNDVWSENLYLRTLSKHQRRRYYKDKWGPSLLKTDGKYGWETEETQ